LLAGVTGSGKTTTIASMLNYINHNYRKHILTLEDPIEFTFTEDKCLINQREVGNDVVDFGIGMKHAVREDPDVMLVGEMRDNELADLIRISSKDGMQDFTYSLKDLVDRELIDRSVALEVAPNVEALKMALKGIEVKSSGML